MDYSGANTVVPVAHPNGEIHSISVPSDTSLEDLHSMLLASDYGHSELPDTQKQPNADDALENTDDFKSTIGRAWMESGNGSQRKEAAALISNNGKSIPLAAKNSTNNQIPILSTTMATVHTHPNASDGTPSGADIKDAQKTGKTFYVASKDGVFAIAPDGTVSQVYNSVRDATDKNTKANRQ